MNSFSELEISPVLQANLANYKFAEPTAVQRQAIPAGLTGSDVVATAQTGTGKTLAFVIPILESLITKPVQGIGAVVLSPTRELAIQIHETFTRMAVGTGIRAAVVVGGLNENFQLQNIKRGAQVIIATPGRLSDFMGRRLVNLKSVSVFVLDEADRMLDMGFLPTIEQIMSALPANRQTLFFSATIEKSVAHLIDKHTKNPVRIAIGAAAQASEQVDLHVYEVESGQKLGLLQHMLEKEEGSFLVFARTKHGTDRLARKLARVGVRAVGIHGDRTQNQRNQALKGFQTGYYRVLVATDVAARGLHVEGIAHVVNFDIPQGPEDFIHRVGRTGRAGLRGVASTFASRGERGSIRLIERALRTRLQAREVPANLPADLPDETVKPFEDAKSGGGWQGNKAAKSFGGANKSSSWAKPHHAKGKPFGFKEKRTWRAASAS